MSIETEIARLNNAKEAIKTSLTEKGVTVPENAKIDDYPDLIDSIETEGGSELDTTQFRNCSTLFSGNTDIINAPLFDTSNCVKFNSMFSGCSKLEYVPDYNTSKGTDFSYMFSMCTKLKHAPNFDTSNATNFSNMFSATSSNTSAGDLEYVPEYDASKAKNINDFIKRSTNSWSKLTYFGGLKNLGKGFTQKTVAYNNYKLNLTNCTYLSHESLVDIINNLYDLNLTYNVENGGTLYAQSLVLGVTNLAKLTEEEIAIATSKGWNVT